MFSFQVLQVWLLVIGVFCDYSFAVINQKLNIIKFHRREAGVTANTYSPVSSNIPPSKSYPTDEYEARVSDFEATTPVFPLTAPPYDYSPPGLSPPEGEEINREQSNGYSYESPTTTIPPPVHGSPVNELNPAPGPALTASYLPPIKTSNSPLQNFHLPPPRSTYTQPSKPSSLSLKQTYGFPSLPYNYYPVRTQHTISKPPYHLSKPEYQPPNFEYKLLSSPFQYQTPQKLLFPYLSHQQSLSFTKPSTKIGNNPSKYSFYENLENGGYPLLGSKFQQNSFSAQLPPTPPVISYDGWKPMSGAELRDVTFNSYVTNTVPEDIKYLESLTLPQQSLSFPSTNTYQFSSSNYDIPFDFVKSFSNYASSNFNNGFGFDIPSSSNFPLSSHQHVCDESSKDQLGNNNCCGGSASSLEVVKNDLQTLNHIAEPLGLAYGVPSGKQIEGPRLQPKVPVKFRPPVPSGLLESIGKNGYKGFDHSKEFRGQTYIPPAIPEVAKAPEESHKSDAITVSDQSSNSNSYESYSANVLKEISLNSNSAIRGGSDEHSSEITWQQSQSVDQPRQNSINSNVLRTDVGLQSYNLQTSPNPLADDSISAASDDIKEQGYAQYINLNEDAAKIPKALLDNIVANIEQNEMHEKSNHIQRPVAGINVHHSAILTTNNNNNSEPRPHSTYAN